MRENPQEFTSNKKDAMEINGLIKELGKSEKKIEIHRLIKNSKEKMEAKISDKINEKEIELEELRKKDKVASREYPFFVYPEEDLIYLFNIVKRKS
jgi:hypothetical protein